MASHNYPDPPLNSKWKFNIVAPENMTVKGNDSSVNDWESRLLIGEASTVLEFWNWVFIIAAVCNCCWTGLERFFVSDDRPGPEKRKEWRDFAMFRNDIPFKSEDNRNKIQLADGRYKNITIEGWWKGANLDLPVGTVRPKDVYNTKGTPYDPFQEAAMLLVGETIIDLQYINGLRVTEKPEGVRFSFWMGSHTPVDKLPEIRRTLMANLPQLTFRELESFDRQPTRTVQRAYKVK